MPSCSKQESDFEQAQQEFERAHAAREDIDAQIEKVGTDANQRCEGYVEMHTGKRG